MIEMALNEKDWSMMNATVTVVSQTRRTGELRNEFDVIKIGYGTLLLYLVYVYNQSFLPDW